MQLSRFTYLGRYHAKAWSGFPLYLFKTSLRGRRRWQSVELSSALLRLVHLTLKRMPLWSPSGVEVQSLTRVYQPTTFKTIIVAVLALVFTSTSCSKKRPLKGDTPYQKQQNAFFKDASTSPLKPKDLKNFEGLNFFKFDSSYVVTATFKRTPNEKPFEMKTTTDRKPWYVKYGEASFQLHGKAFTLDIFKEEIKTFGAAPDDDLFLPFLDETNGLETYGGGRYINIEIPNDDILVIDFNTAYNPYCAYNEKYSCPIVPRQNYLKTRVEAGIMRFEKK